MAARSCQERGRRIVSRRISFVSRTPQFFSSHACYNPLHPFCDPSVALFTLFIGLFSFKKGYQCGDPILLSLLVEILRANYCEMHCYFSAYSFEPIAILSRVQFKCYRGLLIQFCVPIVQFYRYRLSALNVRLGYSELASLQASSVCMFVGASVGSEMNQKVFITRFPMFD